VVNYSFKGAMIAPSTVKMHMNYFEKVIDPNRDESENYGDYDFYSLWKMSPYGNCDTEMP
jgi:hypothetical protein